jgi:hypothetical protein
MRVIIAAWTLGAVSVAWLGRLPNPYLEYVRQIPPPHPYPVGGVLWVILLMTVQAVILASVLRPPTYNRSWGRALIGFLVSVGFFSFAGMAAMHAPPYFFAYLWWLLAVVVVAVALLVWSGVGAFRNRADT